MFAEGSRLEAISWTQYRDVCHAVAGDIPVECPDAGSEGGTKAEPEVKSAKGKKKPARRSGGKKRKGRQLPRPNPNGSKGELLLWDLSAFFSPSNDQLPARPVELQGHIRAVNDVRVLWDGKALLSFGR